MKWLYNGSSEICNFNDGWPAEDKKNALAHLKAFEFVYSLVTLFQSLSYIKEAVVKLQGKSQDLVSGMGIIEQCSRELKREREKILTTSEFLDILLDWHSNQIYR